MKNIVTTIILFCAVQTIWATQPRKVLFIGIDGCRSDAFQQANTPSLDAIIPNSLFTYDSWHTGITWSGPSWSTILTGVEWNKHGVTSNAFTGSNFAQYNLFPALAKQIKPSLKTAEVVEWNPLADNMDYSGWDKKIKVPDGGTVATADSGIALLQDPDLDALFVYFDKVDLTGHSTTFDPANPLYINAIQTVDSAIGRVLAALYARPNILNEDWLVLVTTDHGGKSFFHGGNSNEERHIWWIAAGNAVTPHQYFNANDPGTYNCHANTVYDSTCVTAANLHNAPLGRDIAVTALHHLIYDSGIRPEHKTEWQLDGISWLKSTTGIASTNGSDALKIYPNPASQLVSVWFNNTKEEVVNARVVGMNGQVVNAGIQYASSNKIHIDVAGLPAGNYSAEITVGRNRLSRQFTVK
ncbi:MAG: alkaline phosphatase family protein [Chitinophagales bacterium]